MRLGWLLLALGLILSWSQLTERAQVFDDLPPKISKRLIPQVDRKAASAQASIESDLPFVSAMFLLGGVVSGYAGGSATAPIPAPVPR